MAPDTNADAIFKSIMAIFAASFIMPDGIVMNPEDWLAVRLWKIESGEDVGDGPFGRPVKRSGACPSRSPAVMPAGVALVGAFRTACEVFAQGRHSRRGEQFALGLLR